MEKTRNYGIDLLRMVAMYMVVVLHILGQGAGGGLNGELSVNYGVAWFLETAAYCAVNCYALISGYVGVESRVRYTNLAVLWLRVAFYTVGITAVFAVVMPEAVGLRTVVKAFLPVMGKSYWYFTSYAFLFFCIPMLNLAVQRLSKGRIRAVLLSLLGLYSVLQTIFHVTPFGGGYDVLWLGILYLLGAYIRKYGFLEKITAGKAFLGYFAMVLLAWLSKLALKWAAWAIFHVEKQGSVFVTYYSPLILGAAVFLLLLFRRVRLPAWGVRVVKFFSPLAFSVYLIHTNPLVWTYWMKDRFAAFASMPAPLLVVAVLGTAVAIYLCCSLLDFLRELLFRVLKIKERLGRLEDRWITPRLYEGEQE